MPRKKISVLVVDDSAFMVKAMRRMLGSDPMIRVIGDARDGIDAVEKTKQLRPDVVTLDVKMPRLDGIRALKQIMRECPTPVLMVSALTSEGGGITLQALEAGAVDFIDKSSCHTMMDITSIADTLIQKVKVIADDCLPETAARLEVLRRDGVRRTAQHDLSAPLDLAQREDRVRRKAAALIGADTADTAWAMLRQGGLASGFAALLAGRS